MLENNQLDLFPTAFKSSDIGNSAFISDCGEYRYELRRIWSINLPKVLFIMLNPSTADANIDDPTIRRCIGFAKSWGYGGILVGNLFAYRATNPKKLLTIVDPIGADNLSYLEKMYAETSMVICAWGNSNIVRKIIKKSGSDYKPLKHMSEIYYLELSNDGTPKHPLYLKKDLIPKKYEVSKLTIN